MSGSSGSSGAIAVVGGGPAGLAAAWRLVEAGKRVRLYEASSRIGGRLRTEEVAGRRADAAVQLLSGEYTRTLELLEAMGVAGGVVQAPGVDAVWRDGKAHPLRYGSVTSMIASGALPTALKLRMGIRYVPFLERHRRHLDLNAPVRAASAGLDRESIAEWGRAELGAEFVEWLVYPLLAAYYGVAPEETSAGFFHCLAKAGLGVEVHAVHQGFGALAAAMAEALAGRGVDLVTGAPVTGLEPAADGADGVVVVVEGEAVVHRAVVLAVPAGAAAGLVPEVELVRRLRVRSTATLVLATRGRVETGWFGLSIPRSEPAGETLAAVCVQGEKGAHAVGGSLVLVPTPSVGERWAVAEGGAVLGEGLEALRRVLPGAAAGVEEGRLVRLTDTVWVPEPGHFERLAAFRHDSLPAWLALAGDYMVAPTVEGAVRSGLSAADRILTVTGAD